MPLSSPPSRSPLEALGADPGVLADLEALGGEGTVPARVVRVDRIRVAVHDGTGVRTTDPDGSRITDPDTGDEGLPAVGDWVVVTGDPEPAVRAIAPRRGRLVRRDPGEPRPQILAVGVDVAVVTVPLDRPIAVGRVERLLVTAFDAGAEVIVALAKADLVGAVGPARQELDVATRGVRVIEVHAPGGRGVEDLRAALRPARTGVLLGPSGAGKSTLANAVVGAQVRATAEVRASDRKGRHTTATRALLSVPGGGLLIDTPGLRALGLWDAEEGLRRAFADITAAAEGCRFSDCTHADEPGCAVRRAVAEGRVEEGRLARFRALFDELVEHEAERQLAERHRRRRADRRPPPGRRRAGAP